jgi:hypothetical protein
MTSLLDSPVVQAAGLPLSDHHTETPRLCESTEMADTAL